jgi:hypothetical protein
MEITVKGLDEIIQNLQDTQKLIKSNELKKYIAEQSIKEINKIAQERLSQNGNYISNNKYEIVDNGILIYNDVQNEDGFNYSLIIEYGSGTHAEIEHIGTTDEFIESDYTYWISGLGVRVSGQEPKHIYTDAAKIIEKKLSTWGSEFLKLNSNGFIK